MWEQFPTFWEKNPSVNQQVNSLPVTIDTTEL